MRLYTHTHTIVLRKIENREKASYTLEERSVVGLVSQEKIVLVNKVYVKYNKEDKEKDSFVDYAKYA